MGFLHRGNAYLTGTEKATCIRWQFLFTYRTCTCFLQMHILYPSPSFTLILIFYLYIYFFQEHFSYAAESFKTHPHFLKLFFLLIFFFCCVSFLLVFPGITFLFHQEASPPPSLRLFLSLAFMPPTFYVQVVAFYLYIFIKKTRE